AYPRARSPRDRSCPCEEALQPRPDWHRGAASATPDGFACGAGAGPADDFGGSSPAQLGGATRSLRDEVDAALREAGQKMVRQTKTAPVPPARGRRAGVEPVSTRALV